MRKYIIIGIMLSFSIVIGYFEMQMAYLVPGLKIGLVNIFTLILLYWFRFNEAFIFVFLKSLIIGILFTGLLSINFLISIIAGCLSLLVMYIFKRVNKFSIFGVSVAGAFSHTIISAIIAYLYLHTVSVFYYLPFALLIAIFSGLLIAYISVFMIKRLRNVL